MANETIGLIRCPIGGHDAEVRRYKTAKAKLYWVCECGMITPNLEPGQRYVEAHMRPLQRDAPNDEPKPTVATEPKPVNGKTRQKAKQKSILDFLFSDDED